MATESTEFQESSDLPWWVRRLDTLGSYFFSGILHLLLLLFMAAIILPLKTDDKVPGIILDTSVAENPPIEPALNLDIDQQLENAPDPVVEDVALPAEKIVEEPSPVEIKINEKELVLAAETKEFMGAIPNLGEFDGRTEKGRAALSRALGGTAASEKAVSDGLEWLKRHQKDDGSWSFDHVGKACDETCTHPGSLRRATVAATSMAMLCFIGAGHTHERGTYQEQVSQGLEFLKSQAQNAPEPGDLRQIASGNSGMYTQGLVTILLCELHGLSHDREVGRGARDCIRFIVAAQDPKGGGWRYKPGASPGDTSVVGWQVMAFTSARMSRISVPLRSRRLAEKFLDSVQLNQGAYYGYMSPQKKASTTAIGLLCRMYQGWKRDHPGLKTGVEYLSKIGPSRDNMYYNYYATQVLHHWGGEDWVRWNKVMRESLVHSQQQKGHSQGSWLPRDPHGAQGGRHYMTCLAILTLEVYYRHLPIYQQRSIELGE